MDGKQARRTGSSSPLGELFDHGLDSWATLFLPVALFSIFGRNGEFGLSVSSMYGILWLILMCFIVSHWEKYNTGILFLPWSYDLSQIGMTVLFFATWLLGQEVWFFRIEFLGNLPSTKVIEIFIYSNILFKQKIKTIILISNLLNIFLFSWKYWTVHTVLCVQYVAGIYE